jgi:signal transduction histidine kinase
MTIRSRITVWYGGVLCASILLMAAVMYFELVYERRINDAAGNPREPVQEEIAEVIFFYGVPTALATVVGGWLLLRRALAPLDKLTEAAERIRADTLLDPLPRTGNGDEVDRLSEVLNATTWRLDESFQRVREFTLHASHELKTPLTVIRSELETALADGEQTERQRERTSSLLEEIDRLTHIVDSLTFLTKADAGQLKMKKSPVALDELLRESVEDIQALAHPERINVQLKGCRRANVLGDRQRLRQLLLILADNATKYNQPEGRVDLTLGVEGDRARLAIANTGAAVSPEVLDRVFERFYRGDASHSGEIDGCGLGLSIARWIVNSHDGEITITSDANGLTTVLVELPVAT